MRGVPEGCRSARWSGGDAGVEVYGTYGTIGVENSHENSSPHGSLVGHRPPVGMSLAVGGTNLELLSRAKKSAVECK